ncbi:hypothetical protein L9F63_025108, partial [Diploptera punctata]
FIENVKQCYRITERSSKCPYSPQANVTALMTSNGQYYAGSPMDFCGADPTISCSLSGMTIRTKQLATSTFVYFLFRESAVKYINCGKLPIIYSHIARVCKNDRGGHLMLKDNWTTFLKARLNCSIPGEFPFYFDEIQGMSYVESENMVYATFTTPSFSRLDLFMLHNLDVDVSSILWLAKEPPNKVTLHR